MRIDNIDDGEFPFWAIKEDRGSYEVIRFMRYYELNEPGLCYDNPCFATLSLLLLNPLLPSLSPHPDGLSHGSGKKSSEDCKRRKRWYLSRICQREVLLLQNGHYNLQPLPFYQFGRPLFHYLNGQLHTVWDKGYIPLTNQ